jgi:sec-independent protein translocase protein TatB
MFDIGWQELFLVAVITILVVGPKELPRVLKTVVAGVRKVRGLANDFQRGIDELARETELDDIRKNLESAVDVDLERELEETIDPTGDITNTMHELENELASTGVENEPPAIADETKQENAVDTSVPDSDAPKSVTSG